MKKLVSMLCVVLMVALLGVSALASSSTDTVIIRYDDGCDGAAFNSVRYSVAAGEPTPEFGSTPSREGYEFKGWSPAWETIADRNVVYVAEWEAVAQEDTSTATSVSTDENGDTVTTVTANTNESTADTSNSGKGDTIGSDVDTGDINPASLAGIMGAALFVLIGLVVWNKKRGHAGE